MWGLESSEKQKFIGQACIYQGQTGFLKEASDMEKHYLSTIRAVEMGPLLCLLRKRRPYIPWATHVLSFRISESASLKYRELASYVNMARFCADLAVCFRNWNNYYPGDVVREKGKDLSAWNVQNFVLRSVYITWWLLTMTTYCICLNCLEQIWSFFTLKESLWGYAYVCYLNLATTIVQNMHTTNTYNLRQVKVL